MEKSESREVARRLAKIRGEFPELKNVSSSLMANYENAHRELVSVFMRMDGEIREEMLLRAYKEVMSFDELAGLHYLSSEFTDFGDLLVEIRFCCGYIGNLAQGDQISEVEVAALIFAYECYWREGDDFLLGNVVENLLRRVGEPSSWKWPEDEKFRGKESKRQFQWLAHEIGKEMKRLASHHRSAQPGWDVFSAGRSKKPAFRDFRATRDQIWAAAKAHE